MVKKKKITAEERGSELFSKKMCEIPELALEYVKFLSSEYGFCGEVMLTGLCHYAQAVEHLKSKNDLYTIDYKGKKWFEEHYEK
jgi:hypothetical protein